MRIAFDGRTIAGNKSGAGVYSANLLKMLFSTDKSNEYKVFVYEQPSDIPANFKFITTKTSYESHPIGDLWESIYLPYFLIRESIDIFHSPAFHLPFFVPKVKKKVKKIVTIHDLILLKFPQTYPKTFVAYGRFMIKMAMKVADAIIVPSENTKDDLLEMFKIKTDMVYVVPYAVRKEVHIIDNKSYLADVRTRYSLPDIFILFVSTIEPRKNIEGLIRAYSELRKLGIEHKLVICGGKGWLKEYERITKIVSELGMVEDIIFTGYVADEDIAGIYSMADLFVYPSIYEGFGFPPLEAMASGCPVITSNTSSLPEVVGQAAIMVNPSDIKELTNAMYMVLTNNKMKLCMKEKGIERAKMFSWERCAKETLRVYEDVYKRQ